MTSSLVLSVAPTATLATTSERRTGYLCAAQILRGAQVQLSCSKDGRAPDILSSRLSLDRSQLRRNCHSNLLQFRRAGHGGRLLGVPSASYGELEAGSETVSATANGSENKLEDLKKEVMRSVSNTNRGKKTTPQQRQSILKLIEELEALNPTVNPVNSPLFSGRWALLYTAPIDDKTADKYAGTEEGPFLARVKPAAFGTVKQSRSVQVIDSLAGVAENIAYFTFFGSEGSLNIRGSVKPAPLNPERANRVNVTFESFVVTIGDWKSPTISLSWIRPEGWVDTTFLDNGMRVGRGDKGSIFVSSRMKDKQDKF